MIEFVLVLALFRDSSSGDPLEIFGLDCWRFVASSEEGMRVANRQFRVVGDAIRQQCRIQYIA